MLLGSRSTSSPRPGRSLRRATEKMARRCPIQRPMSASRSIGQSMFQARLASVECGRGVARSAAQSGSARDPFEERYIGARLAAAALAEQFQGPHDHVFSARRDQLGFGANFSAPLDSAESKADFADSAGTRGRGLERQRIEQIDGHHERLELVETVVSPVKNF